MDSKPAVNGNISVFYLKFSEGLGVTTVFICDVQMYFLTSSQNSVETEWVWSTPHKSCKEAGSNVFFIQLFEKDKYKLAWKSITWFTDEQFDRFILSLLAKLRPYIQNLW